MNKQDTCIIFGTSPFISNFGDDNIKFLLENYTTFGINSFGINYPDINYWIWSDYNLYYYFKQYINDSHKVVVSNDVFLREISKDYCEFNIEYIFDVSSSDINFDIKENKVLMFKTTAHAAINYAFLKGFKNIILCGVDLTCNWTHFNDDLGLNRTPTRIGQIRSRLYKFKDIVNLYTLNIDSDLEIEKIQIKDL